MEGFELADRWRGRGNGSEEEGGKSEEEGDGEMSWICLASLSESR